MTEQLLLVRHGEALPEAVDPQRPLSERGRKGVEKVAAWAAAVGLTVDEVWHSGKLRAAQTAELIAEVLSPSPPLKTVSGLGPNDPVEPIAEQLLDGPKRLLIAGHLPFVGRLLSHLVSGSAERELVEFEAGTLVLVESKEQRWLIRCVVSPNLLPSG